MLPGRYGAEDAAAIQRADRHLIHLWDEQQDLLMELTVVQRADWHHIEEVDHQAGGPQRREQLAAGGDAVEPHRRRRLG